MKTVQAQFYTGTSKGRIRTMTGKWEQSAPNVPHQPDLLVCCLRMPFHLFRGRVRAVLSLDVAASLDLAAWEPSMSFKNSRLLPKCGLCTSRSALQRMTVDECEKRNKPFSCCFQVAQKIAPACYFLLLKIMYVLLWCA
jgi:hypothetical protein